MGVEVFIGVASAKKLKRNQAVTWHGDKEVVKREAERSQPYIYSHLQNAELRCLQLALLAEPCHACQKSGTHAEDKVETNSQASSHVFVKLTGIQWR